MTLTLVEALRHHAALMAGPEVHPKAREILRDAAVLMRDAADFIQTAEEAEAIRRGATPSEAARANCIYPRCRANALKLATQWKDRADDCGLLARTILRGTEP